MEARAMYDKIAQRHLSKGKENAMRFALSGLSCMCAATGKKLAWYKLILFLDYSLFYTEAPTPHKDMFYVVESTIAVPAFLIQFSVGKTEANKIITYFFS